LVFFVSGFIMPRLIDHKLGHDVLGVWDFSWSLVTYFRFVDMGVTASVNRYVARHWGKDEIDGINRVVSSATFALAIAAAIIFIGTVIVVFQLPHWFGEKLNGQMLVTQRSVFYLGAMLSVGTAFGAYGGVLTGCHRWELQTMRNSVWQFITVAGMIVALFLGAGLATLAAITAIGQTLGQLTMISLAYHACPGLKLKYSYVSFATLKELYIYSGKILLPTISEMLLNQTTSVLIIGAMGPTALAIFTRPRALLRQLDALERKMGMILVPTTSVLASTDKTEEIRGLLIKSVRYALYLVLPTILILVFFGDYIMRVWMGPDYAIFLIPAILAIGFIGVTIQESILAILIGMDAHGRGGLAQLIGSIVATLAGYVMIRQYHMGLVGMALAVTVPQIIVSAGYLPWMACRHLGIKLGGFFQLAITKPILQLLPFAICLGVCRILLKPHVVIAASLFVAASTGLFIFYWQHVLPGRLKSWIAKFMKKRKS